MSLLKICSKENEFELPLVCTAAHTSNISIAVPIAKFIAKPRPIVISDWCPVTNFPILRV